MEEEKSSNRLVGLDIIKIIACFLVLALHNGGLSAHVNFPSIMYYASVIAIPLFFMTNGYLLSGKSKKDKWYSYKKIGRILLLTFILNVIGCIIYFLIRHTFVNPFSTMALNLFFHDGYLWHLWFLGALALIYLFFPALDYLYLNKQKYFIILAGFLIFVQCFVDIYNIYSSIKYNDIIQNHIPATFRLETNFSYFILGGILKLFNLKLMKYANLRNVLLLYGAAVVYQFFMINKFYSVYYCEIFYDNLIIICLCTAFFLYISNLQNIKYKKEIFILASLIMVIYIIHPLIIWGYIKFVNRIGLVYLNIYIIRLCLTYIISVLVSWILLKIPYAKELFKI